MPQLDLKFGITEQEDSAMLSDLKAWYLDSATQKAYIEGSQWEFKLFEDKISVNANIYETIFILKIFNCSHLWIGEVVLTAKDKKTFPEQHVQINQFKALFSRLFEYNDFERQIAAVIEQNENSKTELIHAIKLVSDYKFAIDASAVVSITDLQGDISYVNDKFCELSGYSLNELIGQNHRIVNSKFHEIDFWDLMWSTIQNGQVWHGEIRNKRKNGELYWVATTIVPFKDEQTEHPTQYLSFHIDVTEQKKNDQFFINSMILDQETDRNKISFSIHEGLAQELVVLTLKLEMLEEEANNLNFKSKIDALSVYARKLTLDSIKIANTLMPRSMMEKGGFVSALDSLMKEIGITENFTLQLNNNLPATIEFEKTKQIILYRKLSRLIHFIYELDQSISVVIDLSWKTIPICAITFKNMKKSFDKIESSDSVDLSFFEDLRIKVELLSGRLSLSKAEETRSMTFTFWM
jgi:PAS domain S-box-containing protein